MSLFEDMIDELTSGPSGSGAGVYARMSDDVLLSDLRERLDMLLSRRQQTLSMEVYTFVVLRAFRSLKEA